MIDNTLDDTSPSSPTFEELELKYHNVCKSLDGNVEVSDFRSEYETIFRALKKSFSREKHITRKCIELELNVKNSAAKIEASLCLSNDENDTINSLREELKEALDQVEEAKSKDLLAKETIKQLELKIGEISELSQHEKNSHTHNEDEFLRKIIIERDNLKINEEKLSEKNHSIESKLNDKCKHNSQLEKELHDLKNKLKSLLETNSAQDEEVQRGKLLRERLENELSEIGKKLEKKIKSHVDLQYSATLNNNKVNELKQELIDTKNKTESQKSFNDELQSRIKQLNESLDNQKEKALSAYNDITKLRQQLKAEHIEHTKVIAEKSQLQRKFDQEHSSVVSFQKNIDNLKTTINSMQAENRSLQKEIDTFKLREEEFRRENIVLYREKNIQEGKIQRSEEKLKMADVSTLHKDHIISSLEKEMSKKEEVIEKMQLTINRLEKAQEKYHSKRTDLQRSIERSNEEVRLRDTEIGKMEKHMLQRDLEIKERNQECDALRNLRAKLSRDLLEMRTEVNNRIEEIKLSNELVKSLRNEVATKDEAIVKEHFAQKKEKSHKEQLTNENSRLKQVIIQHAETIQRQNCEIRQLESTIRKADEESHDQRKEYDQVINERDILGTQLIRRNDELALLHEKIKIRESTLRKGELQYQDRLEDIRLLKVKIKEMQPELALIKGGSTNSGKIKRELVQKERELFQEKVKVKALAEELENPLNVHRWRKLEGSDISTFELIQKVHFLQKRLIRKTEQVSHIIILIPSNRQNH